MKRALTLLLFALTVVSCGPSFWSETQYYDGNNSLERRQVDTADNLVGRDKAWVLEQVGPPDVILPRMNGDTFVYRNRTLDMWVLRVRPTITNNPAIYTRAEGNRYIQRLNVYFDKEGVVRNSSFPLEGSTP